MNMNKRFNIADRLKNYPKGGKLYSPLCGEVEFDRLNYGTIITRRGNGQELCFTSEGDYLLPVSDDAECLLFPDKFQRDWSKFDPNAKPKFKAGDRIIDLTRRNNHVYEVLEVLEDRYRVTGFGTLRFGGQDDFALAPVQIEFVEPREMYWFVWRGECTMPLLDELVHLVDSAYKPVNILEGEVIYGCGDKIGICRNTPLGAALIKAVGTELRIKEK